MQESQYTMWTSKTAKNNGLLSNYNTVTQPYYENKVDSI